MNQTSAYSNEPSFPSQDDEIAPARRMFIFESGWRVGVKSGSTRELCYMMAPGQDYYHRLLDGEVFLVRDGERLCLSCASRRGLISFEPKQLRDAIASVPADLDAMPLELDYHNARHSDR